mgnify:CR=1 FL=1
MIINLADGLVFGLGNPGSEYADTRHNVGFMVLDRLRKELSSADDFASGRYASVCNGRQAGKQFVLVKPQTFMNLSGQAVRYWMQSEKVENDRILVITDDLSLPFGQIRLRGSGSAGATTGWDTLKRSLVTINTLAYEWELVGNLRRVVNPTMFWLLLGRRSRKPYLTCWNVVPKPFWLGLFGGSVRR